MLLSEEIKSRLNSIKLHTDLLVRAQMIATLLQDHRIPNKDIAKYLDMKPAYLSHLIRVMRLPEIVLDGYTSHQISFTHLILLSRLKKEADMVALYEEVLIKNLTVPQTEKRIRDILYLVDTAGKYITNDRLEVLKDKIVSSVGSDVRVSIIQTRIKAKIVIETTGNLFKTSEFIEVFANRFRTRREKDEKLSSDKLEAGVTKPLVSNDYSNNQDNDSLLSLTNNDISEDISTQTQTKKKHIFDPDY